MQQGSDESLSERKENQSQNETEVTEKDIENLKRELAEAKAESQANLAGWQRAQADLINYRRRAEQEKEETVKFASSALVLKLLPVLDDFERAGSSIPPQCAGEPWVDGIRLIEKNLKNILESQGVKPIKAVGEPFDPFFHEAVTTAPGREGYVIGEVKKGYTMNGRVLRPSAVVVGRGEDSRKECEEVQNA